MTLPSSVLNRLPRYYRYLRELLINNVLRVSSAELAAHLRLTPSQVRTDLNYIGSIGQQGYGYSVKQLYTAIGKAMGVGDGIKAIVICEHYSPTFDRKIFESRGVELKAVFAENLAPEMTDESKNVLVFDELVPFCSKNCPDLAVILPMKRNVQSIADDLCKCGIKGIWNFSSVEIELDCIPVRNTPLSDMLMVLCHEIHNRSNTEKE